MAATPSRLYRLIDKRLDGKLVEFVAARRPHESWRQIADALQEETDVEVSWESLRTWFADRISYEVKVAPVDDPASAA